MSYFQGLWAVTPASSEIACHSACSLIGGWNAPFALGTMVSLATTATEVHLTPIGIRGGPAIWPMGKVIGLEFGGPGAQTHGGGFWGGGYGIQGAAEGILAAKLLNELTTKTTVRSNIHIEFENQGVILYSSRATPEQLRLRFSAAVGRTRDRRRSGVAAADQARAQGTVTDLERLAMLYRSGALTEEEYNQAKTKVLGLNPPQDT